MFVRTCFTGAVIAGVMIFATLGLYRPQSVATPSHPTASARPTKSATPTVAQTVGPSATPTPSEPPKPVEISIMTAGDLLYHVPVIANAKTGDGYDFKSQMAPIMPFIKAADVAICQFEVPVAPPGVGPKGYPIFAVPAQAAEILPEVGWDGCTTSSNHSLDQGWAGVEGTLKIMNDKGIKHVGTYLQEKDYGQPAWYTVTKGGRTIKIAHLAATFGLNGLPVPNGKPWVASITDVDRTINEAKAARKAGADIVIYAMQEGVEYQSHPSDHQKNMVKRFAESGQIDLVFGNHPHVPQPIDQVAGGPNGNGMWVIYSHGNLISNQSDACCTSKSSSGVLATTTVLVPESGQPRVTKMTWTGVIVDRWGGHVVYPLTKELEDGKRPDGLKMPQGFINQQASVLRDVMDAKREVQVPPK